MTQDADQRIADLLREGAPPARDPMFRVAVLGRLERAKYRRRTLALLAGALALAAVAVLGAGVGGATREATVALLVGVALTITYFIVAPVVTRLFARFGG
jgi:hypothetical protein